MLKALKKSLGAGQQPPHASAMGMGMGMGTGMGMGGQAYSPHVPHKTKAGFYPFVVVDGVYSQASHVEARPAYPSEAFS